MAQPALPANSRDHSESYSEDNSTFTRLWLPAMLCLVLIGIESFLLFYNLDDVSDRSPAGQTEPIGTFMLGKNDVRQKPGGTLVWSAPEEGQVLYRGHAIATMGDSEAFIEFLDESELVIEPDSMVILEEAPFETGGIQLDGEFSAIVLRLVKGSVKREGKSKTPVMIRLSDDQDEKPIRLDDRTGNSVFRVVRRAHGVEVTVEAGSIQLDGEHQVDEGQIVSTEGEVPKVLAPPKLKRPKIQIVPAGARHSWLDRFSLISSAHAEVIPKVIIHFEWESVSDATSYRIQISRDPKFNTIIADERVKRAEYPFETTVGKTESKLYYRVAGVDQEGTTGEFSDPGSVTIEPSAELVEAIQRPKPTPTPEPKPTPKPTPIAVAKKEPPKPAPRPSLTPRPIAKAEAAPAAKPRPQTRKPLPPMISEIEERELSAWRLEALYGAVFHHRGFSGETPPSSVGGSGLVPLQLHGELNLRKAFGADQVQLGGTYLLEQATAQISDIPQEATSVALFRAWGQMGFTLGRTLLSAGPFFSNTQEFSWEFTQLASSSKLLGGLTLELASHPDALRKFPWEARMTAFALGGFGVEASSTVKFALLGLKPFRPSQFRGMIGSIEALGRLGPETSYGGAVEVGYAF